MASFILAFHVVFPLFILMAIGYFLKIIELYDEHSLKKMNTVVFRVFLPVLLFLNIYNSNFEEAFNKQLLLYAVIAVIICFVILFAVIPCLIKDKRDITVMVQGIYRSNFVLFGIPVTASIYGNDNLGLASIMAAFIVPLFNILAVVLFESFRDGKVSIKKIIKEVFKNPLVIAGILGILILSFGFKLPELITDTMWDIGNIAPPLSLIVLGGTFTFAGAKKYAKYLTISCLGRLIIVPAIALSIALLLGFRQMELVILMVIFGAPTAVGSFAMAQELGGNGELAGQIVVATSAASIFTIFGWIFIFSNFGLI